MAHLFLALSALLLFSGCTGNPVPDRYIPPEKPGGRVCLLECRKGLGRCQEGCSLEKRACYISMQKQAIEDYDLYVRTQFMERKALDLRPSDFERPETCQNASCLTTCDGNYNTCYERCGGTVEGTPRPNLSPL